ncbi:hypothetical protein N5079_04890 [Planotetraspora sp. A-T 1434]|uniref:hypothetical protein n=1 Tax=Planotetraspora sp. A-T 1434 TaxID=2979219 RepID=UPI0021BFA182|nr:hypothetical protein [Planotetraspora sp. A-T 1434]MCT9929554.1 hypothetical protein [Planotetraspora sp. A-T 1434]
MGFFGTYLYDGSRWLEHEADQHLDLAEPWLMVSIHDSDITTVVYRPAGPGSGVAYLGVTPRTYFEDSEASAPTDPALEAAGLANWWGQVHGVTSDAERKAKERQLEAYLAEDIDPGEINADEDEDVDDLDDAEIFVEVKTGAFLGTLDLPIPDDLSR